MSPIIRNLSADVSNNKHPRNLQDIIGVADRGIRTGEDNSSIRANYKIKLRSRDLKPAFCRDKILSYNCC